MTMAVASRSSHHGPTGRGCTGIPIHRSDLRVSAIGAGGHHLRQDDSGGRRVFRASAQERAAILSRALDLGIDFFDTTFEEEVPSFGMKPQVPSWGSMGVFVSSTRPSAPTRIMFSTLAPPTPGT